MRQARKECVEPCSSASLRASDPASPGLLGDEPSCSRTPIRPSSPTGSALTTPGRSSTTSRRRIALAAPEVSLAAQPAHHKHRRTHHADLPATTTRRVAERMPPSTRGGWQSPWRNRRERASLRLRRRRAGSARRGGGKKVLRRGQDDGCEPVPGYEGEFFDAAPQRRAEAAQRPHPPLGVARPRTGPRSGLPRSRHGASPSPHDPSEPAPGRGSTTRPDKECEPIG